VALRDLHWLADRVRTKYEVENKGGSGSRGGRKTNPRGAEDLRKHGAEIIAGDVGQYWDVDQEGLAASRSRWPTAGERSSRVLPLVCGLTSGNKCMRWLRDGPARRSEDDLKSIERDMTFPSRRIFETMSRSTKTGGRAEVRKRVPAAWEEGRSGTGWRRRF